MNAEWVDRIVYRFTEAELSGLLQLMGFSNLSELEITAQVQSDEVAQSLIRSGIVMPCGMQTLVDRTVTLVIRSAAGSSKYLAAVSPERSAALYQGEKLCVLVQKNPGIVKVEPIRNLKSATDAWQQAVMMIGEEAQIILADSGQVIRESGGSDLAMKRLAQLINNEV